MHNVFVGVPVLQVGRVEDDLFTLPARTAAEVFTYQISFDFGRPLLDEFSPLLPNGPRMVELLTSTRPPTVVNFEAEIPSMITIVARRGTQILENDKEHYIPLRVAKFTPFAPEGSSEYLRIGSRWRGAASCCVARRRPAAT